MKTEEMDESKNEIYNRIVENQKPETYNIIYRNGILHLHDRQSSKEIESWTKSINISNCTVEELLKLELELIKRYEYSAVYYSHPTYMYNTQHESEIIDILEDCYPGKRIVNPKDISVQEDDKKKLKGDYASFLMMQQKYYFPYIKNCEIFVYDDEIKETKGVELELSYANKCGTPIETLKYLSNL